MHPVPVSRTSRLGLPSVLWGRSVGSLRKLCFRVSDQTFVLLS